MLFTAISWKAVLEFVFRINPQEQNKHRALHFPPDNKNRTHTMITIVRQATPTRRNGRDDKPWSSLLVDIGDDNNDCSYGDDSKQRISSCWSHIRVPEPFPRCRIAIGFTVSFALLYQIASFMPDESESKHIHRYFIALLFLQSIATTLALWAVLLEKMRMAFCGIAIAACCICIGLQSNVIQSLGGSEALAKINLFVLLIMLFLFFSSRRLLLVSK